MVALLQETQRINLRLFQHQIKLRILNSDDFFLCFVMFMQNETVYFRGKANREALFHHLLTQDMSSHQASVKNEQDGGQQHPITMAMATEVVLSGFSAGALGVLLGIDQVAHQIHALAAQRGNFNVTVRGLVDSGFFLEYNSDSPAEVTHRAQAAHDEAVTTRTIAINGNKNMDYAKAMRDVFTFMNISAGANAACLQAAHRAANSSHGFDSKSDCIFAANLIPHIKTPIFLIQPQFDSWQVLHIYSQTSTAQGVNEYGKQLVQQLKQVLFGASSVGHGAFVDSCFHHGVFNSGPLGRSTNDIDAAQLLALGMRDVGGELETDWNAAEAFARWYRHSLRGDVAQVRGEVPGLNWFFQDAKFPCKSCCLFSPRIARQSSSAMT